MARCAAWRRPGVAKLLTAPCVGYLLALSSFRTEGLDLRDYLGHKRCVGVSSQGKRRCAVGAEHNEGLPCQRLDGE